MKRWLTIHRDLGLQLFALYLLLIVPFLITLLVFDRLVGLRIRADVEANDLSLARAIAQETDISIDNALRAVAELANYQEVVNADVSGMESLFKVMLDTRPDANLVYRLDETGTMLYHYPPGPSSTVGDDFSFRDYFQRALLTHSPLVSQGRISPTTNQAVATAVMPIWSEEGKFLGLVGVNIKLESLSETLSAIISEHQAEEGLQIVILDSSYKVIAHPEPEFLLLPAQEILPEIYVSAPENENSSHIAEGPNGIERLYTYAPISKINWGVIVSRPTSAAFGTQIILQQITQVAAATFILIGLFFWGMLSVRVIRPIEQLAPISEAIGLNKPISSEERGQIVKMSKRRDQIGHLIRSILRMEDSISDRMREQSTLLETGTAVVSSLDLQTVLDRILEQMGRLLNIQIYAIIQLDEEHGAFRIRASRGLSKRFTEQLSILPSEPDSVTMRALHAKEPIFVSDTETDPSYVVRRSLSRAEGYRAILAVPLNTQHAPPTALLVFHPNPHEFTYNEIQILSSFANQATMAIENAILFERSDMRLQEQSRRLEALIQSMEDGLILSDLKGKVVYANRRISELSALSPEELSGTPVDNVLNRIVANALDTRSAKQGIRNILGRQDKRKAELALELNGKVIHLRLEAFDVLDARNTSIGQGLILQDITADREVDRMKSSLVSTVSHELRTPLAAIKGYASTLLAEDVQWDGKSQREFISVISDETDRLSNLVNNLLDLSRIEAGSLRLSREECQLNEMIQKAAKQALQNGNRFEVQIEAGLPPLYADPPRLESILRNLIENSVKYAGAEAVIRVAVQRDKKNIVFRVSDNGPGIPPEEAKRIFDSFYRVDDSFSRIASGAGLGLAICQGLVRAHGGEIWVEPQEGGACIAFFIPLNTSAVGKPRKKLRAIKP
ncbi:MAG: GAF domain-containing protein [Chloroflexi bacterium]|nr:GAF domain-containing protein [Chloroflexota bacterium]